MDTGQLEAFVRIVREGSFSRAARSLDISQPTISARVQALEREVGGPLFIRSGRAVALTERGESFLTYAERALAVVGEGVEAARLSEAGQRGRVTVGTIESLAESLLVGTLARFHETHPSVDIFVQAGQSDQVVELLRDGVVKLGLITWPYFGPDLETLVRLREPMVLVAAPSHPLVASLAGRPQASLGEILDRAQPFLMARWSPAWVALVTQLAVSPSVEVPVQTARRLVRSGVGATLVPRNLVRGDLASGRLVELTAADLGPMYRESALVRLARGGELSAATVAFVDALQAAAGEWSVQVEAMSGERPGANAR